ncbi:MAG: peptidylprolyl isomerase [Gammaproteobacteria bacterium]|nr:peptidylprolyl isomerase [Gammaproteobacteria bacterium]
MSNISTLPIVNEHSDIEISFEMTLVDGTLVEKTEPGETIRFTLGDGTFISRVEEMLIGLELGTTAKLTLGAERAYGVSDPNNFQTMKCSDFPADMPLEVGHVIGFNTPTGEEIPGTVHEVLTDEAAGDQVVIDFNHPLADATIMFTATIEAIHS